MQLDIGTHFGIQSVEFRLTVAEEKLGEFVEQIDWRRFHHLHFQLVTPGRHRQYFVAVAFGSQAVPAVDRDDTQQNYRPLVAVADDRLFAVQVHRKRKRERRDVVAADETSLRATLQFLGAVVGKPTRGQLDHIFYVDVQCFEALCQCYNTA